MAPLLEAARSAVSSLCPTSPYIATGTLGGVSNGSPSTLQVFSVDHTAADRQLTPEGSPQPAPDGFCRLTWGTFGQDTNTYPMGLIAGGLTNGSILVWDPAKIIGTEARGAGAGAALVATLRKHTGAVHGLAFNTFSPNLLASGGQDGRLRIWDMATLPEPKMFEPGNGAAGPPITHVSWNRKVQHILAVCSASGTVAVWDLKKQQQIFHLHDTTGRLRRSSAVQWNPDNATQLIVACEDDLSPIVQLWDLRKAQAGPLREYLGHNKGVLSLSWSPFPDEPNLLLSCGKDGRTLLWDIHTTEVLGEMTNPGNFDVRWVPGSRGQFVTSSTDAEGQPGKVAFWDMSNMSGSAPQDGPFAGAAADPSVVQPMRHAPAWMKRPCGATFGFGGKLVSFSNAPRLGHVEVKQVVTEEMLVTRATQFEEAVAGGDSNPEVLINFCASKASQAPGQEAETWTFLQVLFQDDARRHLLSHLGFDDALPPQPTAPAADVDEAAQSLDGLSLHASPEQPPAASVDGDSASFFDGHAEDAEDFFENAVAVPASPAGASASPHRSPRLAGDDHHHHHEEGEAGASEQDIQRALNVGNYAGALEACLQADRMADALLIASIAGGDLFTRAQKEYMRRAPRPYMKLVHAIMDNNYKGLIRSRPLDMWKETLAILCAYSPNDEWGELCESLAQRLWGAGLVHPATLCWICAGNVDQTLKHWAKGADKGNLPLDKLQDLMERAVVLNLAVRPKDPPAALSDLVARYAGVLASQGRMGLAMEYLDMLRAEAPEPVAILKDRIYRSAPPDLPVTVTVPPFPFLGEDIQPDPNVQAPAGDAYGYDQGQYGQAAYSYADAQQYGNGSYTHSGYNQGYNQYAAPQPAAPVAPPVQQHAAHAGHQYAAPAPPPQQYQAPVPQRPAQTAAAASPSHWGASQGSSPHFQQHAQQTQQAQQWAPQPAVFTPSMSAPPPAETHAPPPNVFVPSRQAVPPGPPQHTAPPSQTGPVSFVPKSSPSVTPTAAAGAAPQHFAPVSGQQQHFAPPTQPVFHPSAPPQQMAPPAQAAIPAPAPPPPAPTGPPPNTNISNVDTSQVEPALRPVVRSLGQLFSYCTGAPASQAPGKKREMEDNSKRLGQLFWKLNNRDVSPDVAAKLVELCGALDAGDFAGASQRQVALTSTNWDECSHWLTALKRLIKLRQTL